MANPSRPQFKDVIDQTWGQLVADRIIRRYASVAERDADLAGVVDLDGQMVVMTPGAGEPAYLLQRIGGVWRTVPDPFIQRGEAGIILDGASNFGIVFPRPFASIAYSITIQISGDYQGTLNTIRVYERFPTYASCVALDVAGGGRPGAALGFMWTAAGPLDVAAAMEAPDEAATVGPIEYDDDGQMIAEPTAWPGRT
jgi:hypothetical protein